MPFFTFLPRHLVSIVMLLSMLTLIQTRPMNPEPQPGNIFNSLHTDQELGSGSFASLLGVSPSALALILHLTGTSPHDASHSVHFPDHLSHLASQGIPATPPPPPVDITSPDGAHTIFRLFNFLMGSQREDFNKKINTLQFTHLFQLPDQHQENSHQLIHESLDSKVIKPIKIHTLASNPIPMFSLGDHLYLALQLQQIPLAEIRNYLAQRGIQQNDYLVARAQKNPLKYVYIVGVLKKQIPYQITCSWLQIYMHNQGIHDHQSSAYKNHIHGILSKLAKKSTPPQQHP